MSCRVFTTFLAVACSSALTVMGWTLFPQALATTAIVSTVTALAYLRLVVIILVLHVPAIAGIGGWWDRLGVSLQAPDDLKSKIAHEEPEPAHPFAEPFPATSAAPIDSAAGDLSLFWES